MREKEVFISIIRSFILLTIFLTPIAYAAPNPKVDLTPISIYETNEKSFNLTINNLFGNESIEEVRVSMPGFTITDSFAFLGWDAAFSGDSIRWKDGLIETNIFGALFQYSAKADIIVNDTVSNIEITTTGESKEDTIYSIPIEIKNDDTAPLLSNSFPLDGSFLRTSVINQNISIDAEDNETGINTARFTYWPCNDTNATKNLVLDCVNNTCSNQVDLVNYEEGDNVCFEFVVHNYALESSSLDGSAGFDGTSPTINLIGPADNEYGSSNTLFTFNASDNLAPTLTCSLIIDNETIDSAESNNGEMTQTTYDMTNVSEGDHEWKVRCTDWVGLSADSGARNIIIDNTAPTITLNSPANGSVIAAGVIIDISVSDNYAVKDVNYSSSLNSSELTDGTNAITVTAEDEAGNIAREDFTFIVDKTAPEINIISPADNADSESDVNFVFDILDNIDDELNCTIFSNGNPLINQLFNVNSIANVALNLPIDVYEWYIECEDDASNSVTTVSRTLNVTDLTGPAIISDITTVARTEPYPFEVNITDISGVSKVTMELDGSLIGIAANGDIYSGTIQTDINDPLGNHTLTITAEDTFGNTNTFYDIIELIQGYSIDMNVPSDIKSNQNIIISGEAALDDGNQITEDSVILELPGETVNVSIENGTFEYGFKAPGAGTYTITAVIVSSDGFEHRGTISIEVQSNKPVERSTKNYKSSPLRIGDYCGDGICQSDEDCESCSKDCGKCQPKGPIEPLIEGHSSKTEAGLDHPKVSQLEAEGILGSLFGGITGFTVGGDGSGVSNPLVLIIVFGATAGLYAAFTIKKKPKAPSSRLNWENYFEKRR